MLLRAHNVRVHCCRRRRRAARQQARAAAVVAAAPPRVATRDSRGPRRLLPRRRSRLLGVQRGYVSVRASEAASCLWLHRLAMHHACGFIGSRLWIQRRMLLLAFASSCSCDVASSAAHMPALSACCCWEERSRLRARAARGHSHHHVCDAHLAGVPSRGAPSHDSHSIGTRGGGCRAWRLSGSLCGFGPRLEV